MHVLGPSAYTKLHVCQWLIQLYVIGDVLGGFPLNSAPKKSEWHLELGKEKE